MFIDLRPYQIEGINEIKEKKNFGLFWQQRLGKTIVAIKAMQDYKKVLFAVPNNTLLHWYTEIMTNCIDLNVVVVSKPKNKRLEEYKKFNQAEHMWMIISYDVLSQDYIENNDILQPFDYIVLDEAHFLRNHKSIRTKGILKLRSKAKYALAISGTPAVNNAIDILKIFKFIEPESKFGHKYVYKKKYFDVVRNKETRKQELVLKPSMVNEWNEFLKQHCDIKKIHDYLKWLPKNIYRTVVLEMHEDQRYHYNQMLLDSKRVISEAKIKHENHTITQVIRLQQICLDPKLLNINASSIKREWLEEYLENLFLEDVNNEEFVIVFTNLSSFYKINEFKINKKYTHAFLTGEQTESQKQNIIHNFQSRRIKILYCNVKVASLGLTLDEATCTIFLDKSWNPIDNEQASFRMVDTKEKSWNRPKLIINAICNNSIDEKINQVLNDKKNKTNIIYEIEKYIEEYQIGK